jgi:hypothetical protein
MFKLRSNEFDKLKTLLRSLDLERHPVINGVVDGNNLGCIYVNNIESPTAALIWAMNEMFYLVGDSEDEQFNLNLESFILNDIKPKALAIGDLDFNLELYPLLKWEKTVTKYFEVSFYQGQRVPFHFNKESFLKYFHQLPLLISDGYELHRIDQRIVNLDKDKTIQNEILKFWASLEKFFQTGLGYCVLKDNVVIGTCISVFVSDKEYEIGINTYGTEHRGKGLASIMARAFIGECLESGVNPHWSTEDFRGDSISIAKKMGFKELPKYKVFYIPFEKWNVKE